MENEGEDAALDEAAPQEAQLYAEEKIANAAARATAAFDRARRALRLAMLPNLPRPSVRLFLDGSAEFIFPGKLAQALKGRAEALTALIGSNRLSVASTVAEDPDAVSIRISGEILGREQD